MLRSGGQVWVGQVQQVLMGPQAVEKILAGSRSNPVTSKSGKATLIYFVAHYLQGPQDVAITVSELDFDFLGGDGRTWPSPGVVLESPYGGSGLPGATFEGWLCWYSVLTDQADLLLWKASALAGQGVCFALQ